MSAALDSFHKELELVGRFVDRAGPVAEMLTEEARERKSAAERLRSSAGERATPGGVAFGAYQARNAFGAWFPGPVAATQADALDEEAKEVQEEAARWERDIRRVTVLRLVTAFEVFFRQFLVERAAADESLVQRFVESRAGLLLDPPLHLGGQGDAAERISACVDATQLTFSELNAVSNYYAQWFGSGKGFLSQDQLAPPLVDKQTKTAAVADVKILFQLRHVLVHKSGIPNAKYHEQLNTHAARLDRSVLDTTKTPPEALPPDEVLLSDAKDTADTQKMRELEQSLLNLAEHIAALYSG